ncbi:MAG: hypothetical protein JWN37_85 [Candidatus Nomurabacteria bacterium]|nr:hypothetical protein [Candidatus Nomurabacteria bacterium]
MEKFTIGENRNESLVEEFVRRTRAFIEDSKRILASDFLNINLVDKILEVVATYKDVLIQITPKNDDEAAQIKTSLQDLIDLETICNKRKTLH